MGFLDKLLGRGKQAAGDLAGDSSLKREGAHQEAQGAADERAGQFEELAQTEREDAARHAAEREGES